MATSVSTWVWEHSESRHGARLVLLRIADGMRTADSWAWPSVETLRRKTRLTERAVRNAISDLEIMGELEVQRSAAPGGVSRYRIRSYPCKDCTCIYCTPPANFAPPSFSLVDGQEGADFAGAENAGGADISAGGADSAPRTVKNRKTQSSKKNVRDPEPQRDDVDRICAHLAERMIANGCKPPTVTEAWRRDARLLLDADKRTEEQIHRAIDWCQGNRFWRSKVMSVGKLRDKYDQLRLDAEAEREKANGNSNGRRRDYSRGGAGDPLDNEDYSKEATL